MSISGVNVALAGAYRYAGRAQTTGVEGTSFTKQLRKTEAAGASGADAYAEYLKSKYGNVKIQSVGKDRKSLDRIGKSMSGSDVVIAPNILEQMASDPEKAAYYEGKIDDFFEATPRLKTSFAARGLDYQPCGVVVHEDGSVTYIGGCADSPERVAQVNAINKAKREKEAALRRASMERSEEAAKERKWQMEAAYRKQAVEAAFAGYTMETGRFSYTVSPAASGSAIAAYEKNIMEAADTLQ